MFSRRFRPITPRPIIPKTYLPSCIFDLLLVWYIGFVRQSVDRERLWSAPSKQGGKIIQSPFVSGLPSLKIL